MLKLSNLRIFSHYLKSSDCNGRRKLEAIVWEKQLRESIGDRDEHAHFRIHVRVFIVRVSPGQFHCRVRT